MSDDFDEIGGLIALGFIVLVGVSLYAVLRAFGSYEQGDEVTQEELAGANSEAVDDDDEKRTLCQEAEERGEDICWDCQTMNPRRCSGCGGCINCKGDDGGGDCCSSCG